jgi:methylmalonyl-CoA mutase N-terminal domain/subunit
MKLFKMDAAVAERQRARVVAYKAARDPGPWQAALDALDVALRAGENSVPPVIEAVRAGATVGEICDRFRAAFGEYVPTVEHIG